VFTNARLVLDDEIVHGHLAVEDGRIVAVGEGPARGEDCEGDFIVPGLVELHTDHLEVHVAPRPRVKWNATAAIQAHDAQIAASGITTVLDALRVGIADHSILTTRDSRELADDVAAAQAAGRLRAEHRFHLRCEVSEEDAVPGFEMFDDCAGVVLVSLMDHTPGQRQFRCMDAYRAYYQGRNGMSDEAFERFQAERRAKARAWSDRNRRALSERARARGIVVASHDDATGEHVAEAVRDGVTLAEFPTTVEAAEASQAAGMHILMGGPNLVRGGSHSGNVSVAELADRRALDILSSDYVPFSMLQAAFVLGEREGWSLPRAVATVTAGPAAAIGLTDRGRLAEGLRADLARVRREGRHDVPLVRSVWREGRRVA
jgi:alpha-D-ribose 1-methylphosphonate 5-triphosphate diphosphatase